jgi:hypothetical protein
VKNKVTEYWWSDTEMERPRHYEEKIIPVERRIKEIHAQQNEIKEL